MTIRKQNLLSEETAKGILRTIRTVDGMTSRKNRKPRRVVRSIGLGGGGVRSYVTITASQSAESYTGNVVEGPEDSTVVEAGVSIRVKGATENALYEGYSGFADAVNDIYYLSGDLLA